MSKRGTYAWYDLMTTDVEGARAFYGKVVGWDAPQWHVGPPAYYMWKMGDKGMGGLMELPEHARAMGAPSHWIAYVECDDVDATAALAVQLGGRVLVPAMDAAGIGRWAFLADPQGGVFAAFKGSNPDAGPANSGLGSFCWHELMSPDPDAAFDFYAALFGWARHTAMDMGPMGTYQLFGLAGSEISLGGMMGMSPGQPGPAAWCYYAVVDDVARATADIKDNGGQILHGPAQVPGGDWITMATDPQGAMFAVFSNKNG